MVEIEGKGLERTQSQSKCLPLLTPGLPFLFPVSLKWSLASFSFQAVLLDGDLGISEGKPDSSPFLCFSPVFAHRLSAYLLIEHSSVVSLCISSREHRGRRGVLSLGVSAGGGEEQVKKKPWLLLASRPANMVLGAQRGPNKEEEAAWGGRGMKCGMGGMNKITQPQGVCARKELKWPEQEGCVSSGVSVGVLAGDLIKNFFAEVWAGLKELMRDVETPRE